MKNFIRRFTIFMLVGLSVFFIAGCEEVAEVDVQSIQADQTSISEDYYLDDFTLSDIRIIVTNTDGTTQTIPVLRTMLDDEDLEEITEAGTHTLTVEYQGFTTTFDLTLIQDPMLLKLSNIYQLAVEETGIDMTYEEWLSSIKGEEGVGIDDVYIDENEHLIVIYSDDTVNDLGDVVENPVDGREVEFHVSDTHIQWRYAGDETWIDLVLLETITGSNGMNGNDGIDGREVEFHVSDTHIQWRYVGDETWIDLVLLETITGSNGMNGDDGIDGREVEFHVSDTHIQWRYAGDETWIDLVLLETITGNNGKSAYELYIETNTEYTKSEDEWLYDLVNGLLEENDLINIQFLVQGNQYGEFIQVEELSKIMPPIEPLVDGYEFMTWTYQGQEWVFIGYVATEDMVLEAELNPVDYSIDYLLDDGEFTTEYPTEYNIESGSIVLPEPVKLGFSFTGWTYEGQIVPVKDVVIETGSFGDLEFTANWYSVGDMSYDSEQTPAIGAYILEEYYHLEIYDDTFVLCSSTLWSDGLLKYNTEAGLFVDSGNNVYKLDYSDTTLEDEYVLITETTFEFVNSDGSAIDGDTGKDLTDISLDLSEYGYGYFELSYKNNGVGMKEMYNDLLDVNLEFSLRTDDDVVIDGSYLLGSFDVSQYNISLDEGIETFKTFILDNPEFYWMSNTVYVSGNNIEIYLVDQYELYQNRQAVDTAYQTMVDELSSVITEDMSELEKVMIIHDYIILRVDYAYEEDGVTPQDDYWAHNIAGVVLGQGAVCEAYAETFLLLAREFDIYAISVTGTSNNQNHQWNLVKIDEKFYHIDVTWDDAGEDQISYTYLGMNHSMITKTHDIDQSSGNGVDYLYTLPITAEDSIALVKLYENNIDLGWNVSLEETLNKMTNESSDYQIRFYDYEYIGPLLWSSSVRDFKLPSGELPYVNSIEFLGSHVDFGNGYFTSTRMNLEGDLALNSNIIFNNIRLQNFDLTNDVNLNLKDFRLTYTGYHNQTGSQINIIGSGLSEVVTNVDYEVESYSEYDVGSLVLNHGPLLVRGNINNFDRVYNNDLNGYIRVYGAVSEVNIGDLYTNSEYVELIKLDNVQGTIINIGNSISSYGAHNIHVRVNGIENMPMINITGNINHSLTYTFSSNISYVSTTIDGVTVGRWQSSTNIGEYGTSPILYAPNLPVEQFSMRYNDQTYLTPLYTKSIEGNFFRDKDMIEIIENGVLIDVICLNTNVFNTYTIPDTVTEIGGYALSNYANLTSIEIPSSVTTLHNYAFQGLDYVDYIFVPETINTIHQYGLSTQTTLLLEMEKPQSAAYYIPDSKVDSVIYNVDSIVDNNELVYAIKGDATIGIIMRSYQSSTTDLVIPSTIDSKTVNQFAKNAFGHDNSLVTITIPNTISAIPASAFIDCQSLQYVYFAENPTIEYIGDAAFINTDSLLEIHIPSTVTYVGIRAFAHIDSDVQIYLSSTSDLSQWHPDWNTDNEGGYHQYILE